MFLLDVFFVAKKNGHCVKISAFISFPYLLLHFTIDRNLSFVSNSVQYSNQKQDTQTILDSNTNFDTLPILFSKSDTVWGRHNCLLKNIASIRGLEWIIRHIVRICCCVLKKCLFFECYASILSSMNGCENETIYILGCSIYQTKWSRHTPVFCYRCNWKV